MRKLKIYGHFFLLPIFLLAIAGQVHSYCLIRGGSGGGPGGREDCCSQDISQWRAENLPVPMWINQDTDPDLWEGIRASYDIWESVPSAYLTVADSGFTPLNNTNPWDGVNLVSFSNDSTQFPPGSNTIAFTSANWGVNVGSDETVTGFNVIFNDVGFDFGNPPGPGEFSVIGITNHELGHAWAIAHCWEGSPPGCGPNCTTSTMYGFSSMPGVADETLELDDMAALTLAYPKWLLRGIVRDAVTSDPIPYALITASVAVAKDTITYGELPDPLPGNGSSCGFVGGAITGGVDGIFELAALDSVYDVVFFRSGYLPDTVQISFTGIDTISIQVNLDLTAFSSITGTLIDGDTQAGIEGSIILMQNGEPFDTASTNGITGEYSFPNVPITLPPFVVYTGVEIIADIPYPNSTVVDTVIEVSEGSPSVLDLELSSADVFLVDDDEGEDYEEYFTDDISSTGRTFHHFDVDAIGESAVNFLNQFPLSTAVVWFTGDATANTITETEQDSLAKLLDLGGHLFLTGQNIVEDLDAAGSDFLSDYLYVSHDGLANYFTSRGVQGNPVTGSLEFFLTIGSGGANNQTSRDMLVPTPPAMEFIQYIPNPVDTTPQGTAAIYVDGDNSSKSVLMGFGFESINRTGGDTTRATRAETMLAILNWFDGITGIGDSDVSGGNIQLPRVFALNQNYPNPFNPSTSIQFAIPAEQGEAGAGERVTLKVYNLRGQLVAELLDEELPPGIYTIHWDGRDKMGTGVSSGIYLYKLMWGDRSSTRKMVVLK